MTSVHDNIIILFLEKFNFQDDSHNKLERVFMKYYAPNIMLAPKDNLETMLLY